MKDNICDLIEIIAGFAMVFSWVIFNSSIINLISVGAFIIVLLIVEKIRPIIKIRF